MKKTLSIILCMILICLSFTACGGPNADLTEENITKTVKVTEKALKEFDVKSLNKYVDSATLSTIVGYSQGHQQFSDLGTKIFENLKVEITEIDIENKTVTLAVINKDLYDVAGNFARELKKNYSTFQLITKLNDDDFLDRKLNALSEKIDEAQMLESSTEIVLSIEQSKNNLVLIFDEGAEDVVSGGALSAIKSIYSYQYVAYNKTIIIK